MKRKTKLISIICGAFILGNALFNNIRWNDYKDKTNALEQKIAEQRKFLKTYMNTIPYISKNSFNISPYSFRQPVKIPTAKQIALQEANILENIKKEKRRLSIQENKYFEQMFLYGYLKNIF